MTDPIAAAEVAAPTRVDAVTVFPQGAEVTRVAKVRIEAGSHTVVFNDLPREAQPQSIRVRAKSTGGLIVGSVDSRRLAVPRSDEQSAASTRRRIEDEIEKLKDDRARIQADVQAAEAQKSFIGHLAQLPAKPPGPASAAGVGREDWAQILGLIGKEMGPIQKAVLDAQIKMREVDRKIADAEGRLRAEGPRTVERTEVKIAVTAASPLDAELTVRYQVAEAGWTPFYDARLATGSKAQVSKITITRRASIQQRSAEAWEGVTLSLSTTRPSAGSSAPELRPLTVDFQENMPRPMPMSQAAPAPMVRGMAKLSAPAVGGALDEARRDEAPEMAEAAVEQAQVDAGAFQAIYSIHGSQSVGNTGEARRVLIDESDFETTLTARAAPRVDERAFLYAKLTVPRATPWLPGQVALFRDATFVGNGRLPQLTPGQDHELGFGADDRVRVRSASVDEKRGESGIITSSKTDTRNFKLTIKNTHERQINFVIQDQIPVANNQDIKVELIARPAPTKRDIDDRRGVLAWEDKLNPDEEKIIEFGYKVAWPAAKTVLYGR